MVLFTFTLHNRGTGGGVGVGVGGEGHVGQEKRKGEDNPTQFHSSIILVI